MMKKEINWYINEINREGLGVRTLQRNISTQYYRRLLSSNNPKLVHKEMIDKNNLNKHNPIDFIKDPFILEFLNINEDNTYLENDIEEAIINNLQKFMMELGKGYAFVARQKRIHTEKKDYFIDLVFYNYILKCFVLIDLKMDKICYEDVGQMDMYIKIYDELIRNEDDNPILGVTLCSDNDEDIARCSMLNDNEQLFSTKYKLYLPTDEELRNEIEKEKMLFLLNNK